ncbi:hypothetical protein [Nocardiopsis rhodophaea]|uniref:hypothetical protein n=1 Tax=Nocardiopsis rhodophaea TaxID=280238 RepID=UPI0031E4764F
MPRGGHLTFTDAPWLYANFDLANVFPPELAPTMFGTLSGDRSYEITRTYIGAFLDRHLRGVPCSLLDRPSPAFPEVEFVRP